MSMSEAFLIHRGEAAQRYGLSLRELEYLYKRDRSFPMVRNGRSILIVRDEADKYFRDRIGENLKG